MSVQITKDQERVLREFMNSGEYTDEGQVIDDALMALKARRRLQDALQIGLDELDRGEGVPADLVFQELRERAAELEKSEP